MNPQGHGPPFIKPSTSLCQKLGQFRSQRHTYTTVWGELMNRLSYNQKVSANRAINNQPNPDLCTTKALRITKTLAAMEADCCVTSCWLCLGKKISIGTDHKDIPVLTRRGQQFVFVDPGLGVTNHCMKAFYSNTLNQLY